ncbi:GntR family transcriptional regulator [Defluviimonas sp. WL0075]|uniref:GntR family transcriptional regulator n=1 Tax=Albidovulum sediminicola TaxID=2984331 RepID=A0ABT2Z6C8_9RHOB|nr:GntR family transcriptional regulator [Defluviimonas sp. WL0075]MCV2866630.1 GntR family transcriptional regulator [Defluviimonas sp. WL0075]
MELNATPSRNGRPRASHRELAQRILDHVRERGLGPGARLPEQALARACKVSRTPVRAALDLLVDQGFAQHEAASGYRLSPDFLPTSPLAGPPPGASDADLAGRILRDRAARRLDDSVSVGALMRRYGCARSAVTKAVARLAEDGLLVRAPGQAWVFTSLPHAPASQADSHEFRLLLEPQALSAPGFRLDPDRAAGSRAAMTAFLNRPDEGLDPKDFQALDTEFHGLIARGAANRFVAETLAQHLRMHELPGATRWVNPVRQRQAMLEHIGILDQMEAGRFDVAADLLRVHLRLSQDSRPRAASRGAPPLPKPGMAGGSDG